MSVRKWIVRALLLLVLAVLIAAGGAYVLSTRAPAEYRPAALAPEQQEQHRAELVEQVADFHNQAGAGQPFRWTISQQQANDYLSSLDAFARLDPGNRVVPSREMERVGLRAPAVAMRDSSLRLMVYSTKYDKVLAADVAFQFDAQGRLRLAVESVQIGSLPVPASLADQKLATLREQLSGLLRQAQADGAGAVGPVATKDLAELLAATVSMLDGQAVDPVLPIPGHHTVHRVRIQSVTIADGKLTLEVAPVGPAATSTNSPAPASAPDRR
jgi:hypothetical protein